MKQAWFRSIVAIALVAVTPVMMSAPPAGAKTRSGGGKGGGTPPPPPPPTTNTGIDVSWPQCGATLPTGEAFAVIGINDGLANNYNPCLGTEFSYAQGSTGSTSQPKAQAYLNTGDPGNSVGDWPSPAQPGGYAKTSTPSGECGYANGTGGAGANSPGCAYIYGYDMVVGITYVAGDLASFQTATGHSLWSVPTWLDVETGNSWLTGTQGLAMNVADLQGMVDAIRDAAKAAGAVAAQIGVYSTSYQWGVITGTPTGTAGNLAGLPDWIPGASDSNGAATNCTLLRSFNAARVAMTQWTQSLDGDYSCP